ncbi:MAG: hypothetical protein LBL87_01340 [Ruminococcus sp.]|nr:hypothetical protein [Ruminococcus sp.]
MRKAIIPVIIVVVVIVGAVVIFGGGLSGRYEYVSDGGMGKMSVLPIGFSDYLEFNGNEVTYNYMVMPMTNVYEIKNGKIHIHYMGTTFTHDFKKSGNSIFIGETEWRKS